MFVRMKYNAALLILSVLLQSYSVSGFSSGAPTSQCGSLTPGHDLAPLDNSMSPFNVQIGATTVSSDGSLSIKIGSPSNQAFKGFMVQVRDDADNIIGSFPNPGTSGRHIQCSHKQDTVTHQSSEDKTSVELTWNPAKFTGKIKVLATVAVDYSHYYVKLESDLVTVEQGDSSPEPEPESEPESEPEAEPEAESEPEAEAEAESEPGSQALSSPVFDGCGQDKSCFGEPAGCESKSTCDYIFSWVRKGDKMVWEGFRRGSGYVAVGISEDPKMGNDVVFLCNQDGVAEYANLGKSAPRPATSTGGVNLISTENKDGNLYCKFESDLKLDSSEVELKANTEERDYHLLIAQGDGKLSYHGKNRIFSGEPLSLTVIGIAGAGSNLLLRLHGVCMIAAWIGCVGTGIIMARYFKQAFPGKKVGGKDLWFQAHRSLMMMAVLLTVVGLILVLVYTGGWHYSAEFIRKNPHPVTGLVTIILAFIQPIMAFFRPHPGTTFRGIFNIFHWSFGSAAFSLGVTSIFLSAYLSAVQIPAVGYVVCLVLYIIGYVAVHLTLSLKDMCQNKAPTEVHPMTTNGKMTDMTESDDVSEKSWKLHRTLLLVFIVFSFVIVFATSILVLV